MPIKLGRPRMTPQEFSAKWADNELKESAASKEHFLDVCALVGSPTPRDADKQGDWFAFEKGVAKGSLAGVSSKNGRKKQGFADVFLRGSFAWEYKGPHKDLDGAYAQLQLYRDALENPPLMIVSDMDRFMVRTNFNDMAVEELAFTNQMIGADDGTSVALLRTAFSEPYSLVPGKSREAITREVAERFGVLAKGLRERGEEPHAAASFLMRLVFCLFAEDANLLPEGLFGEMISASLSSPERFPERAGSLFRAMAEPGGEVNWKPIRHFNGGLFTDDTALSLTREELGVLDQAAKLDWGAVEPAVFGTLFERSLDPKKRGQLGAQYTSREDIMLVVEPVLMAPLRREWDRVRGEVEVLVADNELPSDPGARTRAVNRIEREVQEKLERFAGRIRSTRVLDPACGSGNFLYVSLALLLDLEKEVSVFAGRYGRGPFFPEVGPHQVLGMELDPYAHELAGVSVWIGYLQWLERSGYGSPPDPVLGPMTNILEMDAVLTHDGDGRPVEPKWPRADIIVGNPPFLGDRKMRRALGDDYVDDLRKLYKGRVPGGADLVTYWFEKARAEIESDQVSRAGLISTNGIRHGASRRVLERVKQSGDIFMARPDRPWIQDGAAVRVSMIGFDDGSENPKSFNGRPVASINADLTEGLDLTAANRLSENKGVACYGTVKIGPFDIDESEARRMLAASGNPNGRPNSDVVRPWMNARDVTQKPRGKWAVDFGVDTTLEDAALYEAPFEYLLANAKPMRDEVKRKKYRETWWLFGEPGAGLRRSLAPLRRYAATPYTAKHRIFVWLDRAVLPDHQLVALARDDDYFLGVLHSRPHELWALRKSNDMGKGNDPRYSPTVCFETFPLPFPPGEEPDHDSVKTVANAAHRLDQLRTGWMSADGVGEADRKKRTLTNLYNDRPTWLRLAHTALDRAVFAAYGWTENPEELPDEEILKRLLALNLERAAKGEAP